jgi:hypothetical protein
VQPEKWVWGTHIQQQVIERKISKLLIQNALDNPDEIVKGKKERIIYHKIIENGKLLRVITENNKIITAYLTNKISKYWKGAVI